MAPAFSRRSLIAATAATVVMGGLAACSSGSSGSPASASASASTNVQDLTKKPGTLTIATGKPAYSPWVENDDPASGKGFEAAVSYAVAEKLGFTESQVVWTRTTFDEAITPGPKSWDLNIQQFSITTQRKKAVDFSSPYYTTSQAVLTYKGSPAADATSLASLKAVKFGVPVGTTSQNVLTNIIAPTSAPSIFNSQDDAVQALKNKQVQALVVDLPTALYLASAELTNGKIVGQLADTTGGDQYGFMLQKNSQLTAPVSAAVDALRKDGTLAALQKKWLSDSINVPVLS